jgi:hypothetical protein
VFGAGPAGRISSDHERELWGRRIPSLYMPDKAAMPCPIIPQIARFVEYSAETLILFMFSVNTADQKLPMPCSTAIQAGIPAQIWYNEIRPQRKELNHGNRLRVRSRLPGARSTRPPREPAASPADLERPATIRHAGATNAVAAHYALAEQGLDRVLIVDFDVHHGNGTQDEFEADPAVLYVSTHQYPHYPGTGYWNEIGSGNGKRSVINVPLGGGVGDEGFAHIFQEIVAPAAWRFQPELILVSAGYDAHWDDPLAYMQLSIGGYAAIAQALKDLAEELCGGRVVFTLEGGYHIEALAYSILNTFGVLLGDEAWQLVDPLGPSPSRERPVSEIIERVKQIHGLTRG